MEDEKKSGEENLREVLLEMSQEGVPKDFAVKYREKYNLNSDAKISYTRLIARKLLTSAAAGDATALKEVSKLMGGTEDKGEIAQEILQKVFKKVAEYVKMPETLSIIEEAFQEFYREEYEE
jgi:hypothetical protein